MCTGAEGLDKIWSERTSVCLSELCGCEQRRRDGPDDLSCCVQLEYMISLDCLDVSNETNSTFQRIGIKSDC